MNGNSLVRGVVNAISARLGSDRRRRSTRHQNFVQIGRKFGEWDLIATNRGRGRGSGGSHCSCCRTVPNNGSYMAKRPPKDRCSTLTFPSTPNNKVLRDETDSSVQQQRPLIRDLAMASPVFTFAYNSTTRSCQNGAETWQNPCRESCHTKEPSNRKQVRWTACTIDNEHLQRRSSKSGSYPTPADLDSFLSEDENASSEEEPTMPNLRRASRDSDGRTAAKGEPPRKRSNN